MSARLVSALLGTALLGCGRGSGPTVDIATSPPTIPGDATDPALAVAPGSGDILVAWVAGSERDGWQIYFSRSRDTARTWSDAVRVTDRTNDVHPHGESSPRLVVGPGGALAVVWTNSMDVAGRRWPASNIRFARSLDAGRTWSAARTLNDDTTAGPGGHIFHGAAWSGDSGLLVAWLDERGGAIPGDSGGGAHAGHHPASDEEADATIYLARSTDFGAHWKPNRPLWGAACPCCRVTLARKADGQVIAGWRKHFPGSVRDPVVAPVSDVAAPEIRVASDEWVYPGCPHTGPGVSVDAAGTTHVAWYVGKRGAAGVFYARSPAREAGGFEKPVAVVTAATLPTAHPRVAALGGGGALVASDVDPRGQSSLVVARITAAGQLAGRHTIPQSSGADHPDVIAIGDGTALLAWAQRRGDASSVRIARVKP